MAAEQNNKDNQIKENPQVIFVEKKDGFKKEAELLREDVKGILNRVYPSLKNFPKAEKYSLCSDIKGSFFDTMKHLTLSSEVKSQRLVNLQNAQGHFIHSRELLHLSKSQGYISKGFWEDLDLKYTSTKRRFTKTFKKL